MLSLPPITLRLRGWKLIDRVALAFLLCILPCVSSGQEQTNNERPAECGHFLQLSPPNSDLPAPEERVAPSKCSSYNLYFGIDGPIDLAQARKCAYLERENNKGGHPGAFDGAGLLAMIYANGKGAARNFDLALKFSCEVDGAEAENFYRFQHLSKLRQENWTGTDFSLCDDSTSGFMMGWCERVNQDLKEVRRNEELKNLTKNWTSEELRAFSVLQQAANRFFEASSRNEVDLSGTARAAFELEAEGSLRESYMKAIKRFEKSSFPSFASSDFKKADSQLNSVYSKIQSVPGKRIEFTTVTPEGIKVAQRAWLRYRDAWVAFGAIKYPTVSGDSWRTWLTLERVKMLQDWIVDGT